MNTAVILLGSNKGDKLSNLENAKKRISAKCCELLSVSSVYKTDPWGNTHQPDFLNQVIVVQTQADARELMRILLSIEAEMGRKRKVKWSPRLIDLDILYFNHDIIDEEDLTIPHKHLHERRFVLAPLAEILPQMMHPLLKKNSIELLEVLNDGLSVHVLDK